MEQAVSQEDLVKMHMDMVAAIAKGLIRKLTANVEVDDLTQIGMLGLLDAASRYEPGKGAAFKTFATCRVRGAMLDSLRKDDSVDRKCRVFNRRVQAALSKLTHQLMRRPLNSEVAAAMGVSLDELHDNQRDVLSGRQESLDCMMEDKGVDFIRHSCDGAEDPANILKGVRIDAALNEVISKLPDRLRFIIECHYIQGLQYAEIGIVLGVSTSRICQLHGDAVKLMRHKMRQH